jgi:hypothetical protein
MNIRFAVLPLIALSLVSCQKKPTSEPTIQVQPNSVQPSHAGNLSYKAYRNLIGEPGNISIVPSSLNNTLFYFSGELKEEEREKIKNWNNLKNPSDPQNELKSKLTIVPGKKKSAPSVSSQFEFQGKFVTPFSSDPALIGNFQASPYATKSVPIMQQIAEFPFFSDADSKWVKLTFVDSPITALLALPKNKFELAKIENKLDETYLSNIEKNLKTEKVEIVLPNFKIENQRNLNEVFLSLGSDFLYRNKAFIKKSAYSKGTLPEVTQTTVYGLSHLGMNVAGSTHFEKTPKKELNLIFKKFHAIEPFLLVLRNSKTNELLMLARAYQP